MGKSIRYASVSYARSGASTQANALGRRPMQERIDIGPSFSNDTERLEKPFDRYTKKTSTAKLAAKAINIVRFPATAEPRRSV